jgi:hypothetical protein
LSKPLTDDHLQQQQPPMILKKKLSTQAPMSSANYISDLNSLQDFLPKELAHEFHQFAADSCPPWMLDHNNIVLDFLIQELVIDHSWHCRQ